MHIAGTIGKYTLWQNAVIAAPVLANSLVGTGPLFQVKDRDEMMLARFRHGLELYNRESPAGERRPVEQLRVDPRGDL